jgi:hypothetical protein
VPEIGADHRRSEAPVFAPGDRVWLSTQNLPLRLLCRKLGPQFVGPFKVLRRVNKVFFILPLFNWVGKLRTSSHLQLRHGQDKFYTKYSDKLLK